MAYSSLDYYFAHRPAPSIELFLQIATLAMYIFARLIDSFLKPML